MAVQSDGREIRRVRVCIYQHCQNSQPIIFRKRPYGDIARMGEIAVEVIFL